ncbi:hypothetical protein C5S42_01650 [Candidatus Methanomarinus sp.]|nr:hypothetical protein C5S42_01650 [ANME-2 cluster archaeon]
MGISFLISSSSDNTLKYLGRSLAGTLLFDAISECFALLLSGCYDFFQLY